MSKKFSSSNLFSSSVVFSQTNPFSGSFWFEHNPRIFIDENDVSSDYQIKYIAISVSVGVAIIGIAIAIFLIVKKKRKPSSGFLENYEKANNNDNEYIVSNPLKGIMDEDDPFAKDFADETDLTNGE